MRRLLLFVALLALTGLTTAFASSFAVETEDVASFTPDVSISIPAPTVTPFPPLLYVRGADTAATGSIDLVAPAEKDQPQSQTLVLDTTSPPTNSPDTRLQMQSETQKYRAWISPPAPTGGYLLRGNVTLFMSMQQAKSDDRMTAGLFICAAASPVPTGVTSGCLEITKAIGETGASGDGVERQVRFGAIDATIPSGSQLVLKVVNLATSSTGQTTSTQSWILSWGFLESRQSRLEIG